MAAHGGERPGAGRKSKAFNEERAKRLLALGHSVRSVAQMLGVQPTVLQYRFNPKTRERRLRYNREYAAARRERKNLAMPAP